MRYYVLDTNTVVSAYLLEGSVSRQAYNKAFKEGIVIHSEATLTELAEVLARPKFDRYVSLPVRLSAIREFEQRSLCIPVENEVTACRDPKDDKFLSLALAAGADCIISGDIDLLTLHPFRGIPVLSPADFLLYRLG